MPYVKPAEGLSIPDPDRRDLLPAVGRHVPDTAYWIRRLADRDVEEAEPPEEPPADQDGQVDPPPAA